MRTSAAALALLLTAACGSSSDPAPAADAPPATTAPAGAVSVVARDYSFAGLEDVAPKAGDTLQLAMLNNGQRPHDLAVTGPDGADLGGVDTLDAGERGTGSVALAAAGVYTYVCTIGSHAELGMKGTFTVS